MKKIVTLITFMLFSLTALAAEDFKHSSCFKSYKESYNKKFLYNFYGADDELKYPAVEIFEKQVMDAATFEPKTPQDKFKLYYPRIYTDAEKMHQEASSIQFQKIVREGFSSGIFCSDPMGLFRPFQVMAYINAHFDVKMGKVPASVPDTALPEEIARDLEEVSTNPPIE
jgi:hypothetical protein